MLIRNVIFYCFPWATDLLPIVEASMFGREEITYKEASGDDAMLRTKIITHHAQMLSSLDSFEGIIVFPDKPGFHVYSYFKEMNDQMGAENFIRINQKINHLQTVDEANIQVIGICGTDRHGQYPMRRWESKTHNPSKGPIFSSWILPPDHPAQISLAIEQLLFRHVTM